MKILFVAMAESIHTARWINQITGQGWDVSLFPSTDSYIVRPELDSKVHIHQPYFVQKLNKSQWFLTHFSLLARAFYQMKYLIFHQLDLLNYRERIISKLNKIIVEEKPDIIHSMEFQHAGYLVSDVKKKFLGKFPTWIVTNWGSDIYWFKQFPDHEKKIKDILENADYYSAECNRDVCLAKDLGIKSKILPVLPNTGGFDLERLKLLRSTKTSDRKIIMLKGYHGWAGRALIGLQALLQCQKELKGYRIVLYSVSADSGVGQAAKEFTFKTGIPTEIIPTNSPHYCLLEYHAQARISIGLSITDGASVSLLEALTMGSFPIQSNTACTEDWFENGKTGLVVPPENVYLVAKAIRRALGDDQLVDQAAKMNWLTVKEKLDQTKLTQEVVQMYQNIFKTLKLDQSLNPIAIQKKINFSTSEFLLVLWFIIIIVAWIYLMIIYGIQKLHLFGVNVPFQNLTTEGGQWLWGSDWSKYLLFKK